jgi:hypothetical protein
MDERLKQLVIEAQQHAPQTADRQKVLIQLVDEILRSRKICRPQKGQPLSGVYLEIYQQLQQQLLHNIDQVIDKYNPQRTPIREWANTLRDNLFKEVLDDEQLKMLALVAQKHLSNSELRKQALIELVNAIVLSGRLCRPHRGICAENFYELIYEEAVNQTLVYVCQKIDNYKPFNLQTGKAQKFMNWVNFRLDKMVIQAHIDFKERVGKEIPTINDLENIAEPESEVFFSDLLRQCLEEDRNNLFKQEHIRNFPNANFRAIALASISGKTWEEISADFEVKVPTLSSFFRRCCQKFAPLFKEYLES